MSEPLYIDKHGHRHTEAVLRHWSPAVLKALGIRLVADEKPTDKKAMEKEIQL